VRGPATGRTTIELFLQRLAGATIGEELVRDRQESRWLQHCSEVAPGSARNRHRQRLATGDFVLVQADAMYAPVGPALGARRRRDDEVDPHVTWLLEWNVEVPQRGGRLVAEYRSRWSGQEDGGETLAEIPGQDSRQIRVARKPLDPRMRQVTVADTSGMSHSAGGGSGEAEVRTAAGHRCSLPPAGHLTRRRPQARGDIGDVAHLDASK
jgi:hypothetical protein